jgi:hypothetical protein
MPTRPTISPMPVQTEVVEQLDQVVGDQGQATAGHPGRGAVARAVGHNHPYPEPLPDRVPREPRVGCALQPEHRDPVGRTPLVPGQRPPIAKGQPSVHIRRCIDGCHPSSHGRIGCGAAPSTRPR